MLLIERGFRLSKASIIPKSAFLKHQLTSSDEKRGFTLPLTTETRTVRAGAACVGTGGVKVRAVSRAAFFFFLI